MHHYRRVRGEMSRELSVPCEFVSCGFKRASARLPVVCRERAVSFVRNGDEYFGMRGPCRKTMGESTEEPRRLAATWMTPACSGCERRGGRDLALHRSTDRLNRSAHAPSPQRHTYINEDDFISSARLNLVRILKVAIR